MANIFDPVLISLCLQNMQCTWFNITFITLLSSQIQRDAHTINSGVYVEVN